MKSNKKAVTELIAYVLLIVIALSVSAGIYAWLKFYVPSPNDDKCSEDVAIAILDYKCNNYVLNITLENKGYFNVNGFFIRATNDSSKIPTDGLQTLDLWPGITQIKGRYDFPLTDKFKPGQIISTAFDYMNITNVSRIQLQPFVIGKKGGLLICPSIADIMLEDCSF